MSTITKYKENSTYLIKKCIFALRTNKGIKVITVHRDDIFWEKIEQKLIDFWLECLFPEIIDSRYLRVLNIREQNENVSNQEETDNQQCERLRVKKPLLQ